MKRGGLITFHGPGQLVAYPIFDLEKLRVQETPKSAPTSVGVRRFVGLIEEVLIRTIGGHFGIANVGRTSDPGDESMLKNTP